MKAILIAAGLMLACSSAQAAEKGWFTPQLIAGDPAECDPLVEGARNYFAGDDDTNYPDVLGTEVPGMRTASYGPDGEQSAEAGTKPYQLKITTNIGCGQACNSATVTVLLKGKTVFSTPEADAWSE